MSDAPPPGYTWCPMCSRRRDSHTQVELAGCERDAEQTAREYAGPFVPAADEHPAPWKWYGIDDGVIRNGPLAGQMSYSVADGLKDANGTYVLNVTNSVTIDFASARVRALIAAAPEIAALLRELRNHFRELAADIDDYEGRMLIARANLLLARIDAAGRTG